MQFLYFEVFFVPKNVKVYLEQIKIMYICIGFKFFIPNSEQIHNYNSQLP